MISTDDSPCPASEDLQVVVPDPVPRNSGSHLVLFSSLRTIEDEEDDDEDEDDDDEDEEDSILYWRPW